jgi:glycosyltransferase involved in cell wall biosynthesis
MKVSIVTVCFNSKQTIEDTFKSVQSQSYPDIEYIVIDGGSTDGTIEVIQRYSKIIKVCVSEKDNGLYDAMNKGISLASGDIIGILNSDDILASANTIESVVRNIEGCSGVYGDVGFYETDDFTNKRRHYSSKRFTMKKFSRGMMPAHPSLYVLRTCYEGAGLFNTNYKIAADFDMTLRIFSLSNTSFKYINSEIVKMRLGGISTSGFMSNYTLNKEILESCKNNGVKASWFTVLSKYPEKTLGYLFK